MEVHSKNEFLFGGAVEHSPRNQPEEPNMMKAIPLNIEERRKSGKSPQIPRSPDNQGNANKQRHLMSQPPNFEERTSDNKISNVSKQQKNIFGKKRDTSVPVAQRTTGAAKLLNKIKVKETNGNKQ